MRGQNTGIDAGSGDYNRLHGGLILNRQNTAGTTDVIRFVWRSPGEFSGAMSEKMQQLRTEMLLFQVLSKDLIVLRYTEREKEKSP